MTSIQIEYNKLLETKRANRAQEQLTQSRDAATRELGLAQLQETSRANREKEAQGRTTIGETKRSNRARELELNRSNLAHEAETSRSNLAKEAETHRSNLVNEVSRGAELAERVRSDLASEDAAKKRNEIYALDIATRKSPTTTVSIGDVGGSGGTSSRGIKPPIIPPTLGTGSQVPSSSRSDSSSTSGTHSTKISLLNGVLEYEHNSSGGVSNEKEVQVQGSQTRRGGGFQSQKQSTGIQRTRSARYQRRK